MSGYSLRPRAEQDLVGHFAYIARAKIAPAERFLKVAERSLERLAEMPRMGRLWESSDEAIVDVRVCPMRSPYRSHLIFYRIVADDKLQVFDDGFSFEIKNASVRWRFLLNRRLSIC